METGVGDVVECGAVRGGGVPPYTLFKLFIVFVSRFTLATFLSHDMIEYGLLQ